MSAQHTPGKLQLGVEAETVCGCRDILAADGTGVASTHGLCDDAGDLANAQRLVACWNACEGLTTDQVEQINGLIPAKLSYQVMQRDREALLAHLRIVAFHLRRRDFSERASLADEALDQIEGVIAKVTGGAL